MTRQKLQGYQSNTLDKECNVQIIVHKCEGRLFLTDRNGFYNDLLEKVWPQSKGNVLLILVGMRSQTPNDSLVSKEVQTMGTAGDQPTLLFFKDKQRILVWNRQPNEF